MTTNILSPIIDTANISKGSKGSEVTSSQDWSNNYPEKRMNLGKSTFDVENEP